MKALTITQPWATLIAVGAKNFETRDWSTRYRGPLAIHAGKNLSPVGGRRGLRELCGLEPFRKVLTEAGYADPADLPLGVVVCTTILRDCHPAEALTVDGTAIAAGAPHELDFGNFAPGRFAFALDPVRTGIAPTPVRGAQKFWPWDG